jgi:tetratricopeptide (TPR) repeat protein
LTANVCASMAHLAVQIDKPVDAIRIADAGLVRAKSARGTVHLRARLCAMRARGLAVNGDVAGSLNAIHAAEKLLDSTRTEQAAEWIANFDLGSLSSEVALCLRALGKLKEAERSALEAIELRNGDRIRSRAFAQLTLAEVLTASGRIDEAATIGLSVCRLMPGLNSARVETGLSNLIASLETFRAVREVRELLASWNNVNAKRACSGDDVGWPV